MSGSASFDSIVPVCLASFGLFLSDGLGVVRVAVNLQPDEALRVDVDVRKDEWESAVD